MKCVFALKNKRAKMSSSGGAFPTIVNAYREMCNSKVLVFGAAFSERFDVEHICVSNQNGLNKLYESKYVRSNLNNAYVKVANALLDSMSVIFVGTPCQVHGLTQYLSKNKIDVSKLITIDLICHGTPPKKLWNDYLKYIQKNKKISMVSFRHRSNVSKCDGAPYIKYVDGTHKYYPAEIMHYMRLFSLNLSLEKCCFSCQHRNLQLNRPGDITIGDFWGVNEVVKDFRGYKNVSLVMANTRKGLSVVLNIHKHSFETGIIMKKIKNDKYLVFNSHLYKQTIMPKGYDAFWDDYNTLNFEQFYAKHSHISKKQSIKRRLSHFADKLHIKWKLKYWKYRLNRLFNRNE